MKMSIALIVAAGLATGASAQVITGYDIVDAAESGGGGWGHTYSGTITSTGTDTANSVPFNIANYSNAGSGTLNDGGTNDGTGNAMLFGQTSNTRPSITLYLDGTYFIDEITIWGFDGGNSIPGNIDGFDATVNGNTAQVFGTEVATNDLVTALAGSGLDGFAASSITLNNFVLEGQSGWTEVFSISEISIVGRPIPAPGAFALLGLGGLAAARRRR
ncbi:MAG: hypothetical protein HND58_17515 [Planctomycetota bacterium]|nr:MAG: hypothetical protein HND58_17515 [Planctomycetota bacterium]